MRILFSLPRFLETVELQISLKNYDPQKDKRFSGTVRFGTLLVPPSLLLAPFSLLEAFEFGLHSDSLLACKICGSWVQCWIARVVQFTSLNAAGVAGRTPTLGLKTQGEVWWGSYADPADHF